jgi:hypothetical protein
MINAKQQRELWLVLVWFLACFLPFVGETFALRLGSESAYTGGTVSQCLRGKATRARPCLCRGS